MKNDEYLVEAQNALFVFQMLEEALKIRIGLFYEINETLKPAAFNVEKLMDTPLKHLINMYEAASGDGELVKDMNSAVSWRNFCAHNAYLHWLYSQTKNSPFTTHSVTDLRQVKDFSLTLVQRVGNEIKSLRAQTSEAPNNALQPIAMPPLRCGSASAEFERYASARA